MPGVWRALIVQAVRSLVLRPHRLPLLQGCASSPAPRLLPFRPGGWDDEGLCLRDLPAGWELLHKHIWSGEFSLLDFSLLVRLLQKHREQSHQEQTFPSDSPWELSSIWGTLSLPLPDMLLTAKREKPIVAIWGSQLPALPHKGAAGRKGVQICHLEQGLSQLKARDMPPHTMQINSAYPNEPAKRERHKRSVTHPRFPAEQLELWDFSLRTSLISANSA